MKDHPDIKMERFRIDVGYVHEVKPGNIVGAIANEADIDSCYIGHIEIHDDFSTVDLPEGMPKETAQILRKARVCGRKLGLRSIHDENRGGGTAKAGKPAKRAARKRQRAKAGKK